MTYTQFNSDQVMRWKSFIEEYSLDLCYVKSSHNIVADALSQLPKSTDSALDNSLESHCTIMKCQSIATSNYNFHPIFSAHLAESHQSELQIKKELQKDNSHYQIKDFHGEGKTRSLVC